LRRRTDASALRPTIRTSPSRLAFRKSRTCPLWRRSKQPLVKTTVFPAGAAAPGSPAGRQRFLSFRGACRSFAGRAVRAFFAAFLFPPARAPGGGPWTRTSRRGAGARCPRPSGSTRRGRNRGSCGSRRESRPCGGRRRRGSRSVDEAEPLDPAGDLAPALERDGFEVLELGVRPVAGHALGIEDPDPEDKILDEGRRLDLHLDDDPLLGGEDVLLLARDGEQPDLLDLDRPVPQRFSRRSSSNVCSRSIALVCSSNFSSCLTVTSWR